jgi:predicted TIM-barrel fold metal-dependent hydrolase
MVKRAVTQWKFCGIKVHGFDAMLTREVCDAARAFGVPVLADVVGQAAVVDMFAPQYPDVNFIVPHLGSFADDWRAQQQVVDQVVRHPNVYADTSGVRRFDYIVHGCWRSPRVRAAHSRTTCVMPGIRAFLQSAAANRSL